MTAASIISTLIIANIAASCAILAVLALREPVRRLAGARVAYMAWLIVPAAILASFVPARVVLIPAAATPAAIEMPATSPEVRGDGPAIAPLPEQPSAPSLNVEQPVHRADIAIDWASVLAVLWALGAFAALTYLVATQHAAVKSLGPLTRVSPNTFRAARSALGPAVVGVLAPRIVLPADFEQTYDEAERKVVIAHGEAHLRDRHTAAKALAHALACLSWFNPLAWIAARAVAMDQELACDDAVAARYPRDRRVYAEVLVKAQSGLRAPLGCYWPVNPASKLKTRIARLGAAAPSPARRTAGASALALLAVAAGCTAWSAKPPEERVAAMASSTGVSPPRPMLADLTDYITVHGAVIRAEGDTIWVKADRVSRKSGNPQRSTEVWRLSLDALVRGAPPERPADMPADRIFHAADDGHDHGPKVGNVAFFSGYALAETCKPECAGFITTVRPNSPTGWPRQNANLSAPGGMSVFGTIIRLEDSSAPSLLVQASASTAANGKVVGDDNVWRIDASMLVEKMPADRRKAFVEGFNAGVTDALNKEAVFTVSDSDRSCKPECKGHLEGMKYLQPGESYAGQWGGHAVLKPVYSASDRPAPPEAAPAGYDTKDTIYIRGKVERIEFRATSYVLFVRSEAYGRDPYSGATLKSDLFELSATNDFGDADNRKNIAASMKDKKLDVWAYRANDKSCQPACRVYTREIFERDATGEISQVGFGGLKGWRILEELVDRTAPLTLKGTVIRFDNTIESASPHGVLWIESTSVEPATAGGAAPKTVWRVVGFPQNVITTNFWVGREVTINGYATKDEPCRPNGLTGEQCLMIGKQIF